MKKRQELTSIKYEAKVLRGSYCQETADYKPTSINVVAIHQMLVGKSRMLKRFVLINNSLEHSHILNTSTFYSATNLQTTGSSEY